MRQIRKNTISLKSILSQSILRRAEVNLNLLLHKVLLKSQRNLIEAAQEATPYRTLKFMSSLTIIRIQIARLYELFVTHRKILESTKRFQKSGFKEINFSMNEDSIQKFYSQNPLTKLKFKSNINNEFLNFERNSSANRTKKYYHRYHSEIERFMTHKFNRSNTFYKYHDYFDFISQTPKRIKKIIKNNNVFIFFAETYSFGIKVIKNVKRRLVLTSFRIKWPKIQIDSKKLSTNLMLLSKYIQTVLDSPLNANNQEKNINEILEHHDKIIEKVNNIIFSYYLLGQFIQSLVALNSYKNDFHFKLVPYKNDLHQIQIFMNKYYKMNYFTIYLKREMIIITSPKTIKSIPPSWVEVYRPYADPVNVKSKTNHFHLIFFTDFAEIDFPKVLTEMKKIITFMKFQYVWYLFKYSIYEEIPPLYSLTMKFNNEYSSIGKIELTFKEKYLLTIQLDRFTGKAIISSPSVLKINSKSIIKSIESQYFNLWASIGSIITKCSHYVCLQSHFSGFSGSNYLYNNLQLNALRNFQPSFCPDYSIAVHFSRLRPLFALVENKTGKLIQATSLHDQSRCGDKIHEYGMRLFRDILISGALYQIKNNLKKIGIIPTVLFNRLYFVTPNVGTVSIKLYRNKSWTLTFPFALSPESGTAILKLHSSQMASSFTGSLVEFIYKFISFQDAILDMIRCIKLKNYFKSSAVFHDLDILFTLPDAESHEIKMGCYGYEALSSLIDGKYHMYCNDIHMPQFVAAFLRKTPVQRLLVQIPMDPESSSSVFPFLMRATTILLPFVNLFSGKDWSIYPQNEHQFFLVFKKKITFNIALLNNNQIVLVISKSNINHFIIPLSVFLTEHDVIKNNEACFCFQKLTSEDIKKLVKLFENFADGLKQMKQMKMEIEYLDNKCYGKCQVNDIKLTAMLTANGNLSFQVHGESDSAINLREMVLVKKSREITEIVCSMNNYIA
ncbi:hypothetical protein TRFO_11986 [Tritrichomonas foetus]|uniref:Uncharacterized protein n=1 Tax=Tritrichomonas foetus TaxID=1144522 RepID=A0A1J4J0L2_9EUKA|nr:hypothetical protein TRFO_11986 [Tritrichomonas foetus]|eukprot:OHS93174.1 hypothetical protein TRFO_11986 [Tritrichomonas foetus]